MSQTLIATPDTVARIRERLPAITRSQLQACFAISETTWTKLRDGRPVKRATLDRILARLE